MTPPATPSQTLPSALQAPITQARLFDDILHAVRLGLPDVAVRHLRQLDPLEPGSAGDLLRLELLRRLGAMDLSGAPVHLPAAPALGQRVPDQQPDGPGVSVVTCCMNRNENLLKAVPTWLALPAVSEVLIVDWNSTQPVTEALAQAGLDDPRIRVVRVEDEPRWVLSFAFNLGFRMARGEIIVKADADITLKPDFFARNPLPRGCFVAGNWREAAPDQAHINGFFCLRRADLLAIKGFNEYITTYGWDDDDIYARMVDSGLKRLGVDTDSLYHIPHDDAARMAGAGEQAHDAWNELQRDTAYRIRTNRWLASVMPPWNRDRVFAPFDVLEETAACVRVRRRVAEMPHVVTPDIRQDAEHYAAVERLSWQCGASAYHAPRSVVQSLLRRKRLDEISAFDLRVAAVGGPVLACADRHTLLIELASGCTVEQAVAMAAPLAAVPWPAGLSVCVNGSSMEAREAMATALGPRAAAIGFWVPYDGLRGLDPAPAPALLAAACQGSGGYVQLKSVAQVQPPAPAIVVPKRRLYVDTQHGLGNRLRALASGAAVADATGRELVVLWTPDHHCDCRLDDLFERSHAVIEDPSELPPDVRRYNYMEIEPGAVKDAPIDTDAAADIVVRSAFVLRHPASHWESECIALRAMQPSAAVQALVDSVALPSDCIGAHVRMEAGQGLDHNTYDSAENWSAESHAAIHHWRAKSHYSAFMKRIDQLLAEGTRHHLFLATDLPENYRAFEQTYGPQLRYLPRTLYDRSREQILYAMADAILLSRCTYLLGSTWSSFSELAMRLSTTFAKIEMSGTDF